MLIVKFHTTLIIDGSGYTGKFQNTHLDINNFHDKVQSKVWKMYLWNRVVTDYLTGPQIQNLFHRVHYKYFQYLGPLNIIYIVQSSIVIKIQICRPQGIICVNTNP